MIQKVDSSGFKTAIKCWYDFIRNPDNAFLFTTKKRIQFSEYLEYFHSVNKNAFYTSHEVPALYDAKILYKYNLDEKYFGRFWHPPQNGSLAKISFVYQLSKEIHIVFYPITDNDEVIFGCEIIDFSSGETCMLQSFMLENESFEYVKKTNTFGFNR